MKDFTKGHLATRTRRSQGTRCSGHVNKPDKQVKFIGSTICYAFMQATGMVNDHQTDCFRYNEV